MAHTVQVRPLISLGREQQSKDAPGQFEDAWICPACVAD